MNWEPSPGGATDAKSLAPLGLPTFSATSSPQLALWATIQRASGALGRAIIVFTHDVQMRPLQTASAFGTSTHDAKAKMRPVENHPGNCNCRIPDATPACRRFLRP